MALYRGGERDEDARGEGAHGAAPPPAPGHQAGRTINNSLHRSCFHVANVVVYSKFYVLNVC